MKNRYFTVPNFLWIKKWNFAIFSYAGVYIFFQKNNEVRFIAKKNFEKAAYFRKLSEVKSVLGTPIYKILKSNRYVEWPLVKVHDYFTLSDPEFSTEPIFSVHIIYKPKPIGLGDVYAFDSFTYSYPETQIEFHGEEFRISNVSDSPKGHEYPALPVNVNGLHFQILQTNLLRMNKDFTESLNKLQNFKQQLDENWQKLIHMLIELNKRRNSYYYRPVELIGDFPINPTLRWWQKPCWIWVSKDNEVLIENYRGEKEVVERPIIRCGDGKAYLKAGLRKIWFECDRRLRELLEIRLGKYIKRCVHY